MEYFWRNAGYLSIFQIQRTFHEDEDLQKIFCSLTTAAAMFAISATSIEAQGIWRTLARTGLVQEDIDIMVRTGATLYASGEAQVGSDVIWSNPQTQAFGMAEILEVDGDCIRIAYRYQTLRQPKTQSVTNRRCLVDNRWILSD